MKAEEIQELVKMQKEIEALRRAVESISFCDFKITFPTSASHYELPMLKISGLKSEVRAVLLEAFAEKLEEAEQQMDLLILCDTVTGIPVTLIEPPKAEPEDEDETYHA